MNGSKALIEAKASISDAISNDHCSDEDEFVLLTLTAEKPVNFTNHSAQIQHPESFQVRASKAKPRHTKSSALARCHHVPLRKRNPAT